MSPVRATWRRTVGRIRNLFSSALAIAGFLSAAAIAFAFNLDGAEGERLSLVSVWTASVSPLLPALAALLSMDVWSDERRTGRIDLLLSVAVRERDYVYGKFLGVWSLTMLTVLFFLVVSMLGLWWYAPAARSGVSLLDFLPALLILSLQGALWCAVSGLLSALFRHSATAAFVSVLLMIALPRGIWAGMMAWSGDGRTALGEMPLDAQAVDFASGLVSSGVVLGYLVLAVVVLFITVKVIASLRFVGRGALTLRWSTGFTVALSAVFAALVLVLVHRLDMTLDLPQTGSAAAFAARTRTILSESSGTIDVTCFLSRNDSRFRPLGHFLRALKAESATLGGGKFELRFVDPRWDLGAAERLVRRGVAEDSLVFEKGSRMVVLPLKDGYGERICASTIRRLTTSPLRRNVYWTTGHGESRFDGYGAFGMSDVARDLAHEGYHNADLDLSSDSPVPGDCALIVIAGAKNDFSRAELGRLESYLREGGRLLVLVNSSMLEGGLASVLSAWGIRPGPVKALAAPTQSGSDIIVSEFSEHAVSSPLRGSRVVLERPVEFVASVAAETGMGADRISFSPLATVNGRALAAAIERGAGTGQDISIRPTRIVVVGDPTFAMNGSLAARANANRDLFLNCVAYLSGTDTAGSGASKAGLLDSSMDRNARLQHVFVTAGLMPFLVFAVLVGVIIRRRRRT